MGIFKKIKKAFKKATSFITKVTKEATKSANPKYGMKLGKKHFRAVGRKFKPKMPEQTKAPVIQKEDEARTKRGAMSRLAARRGARSSSMLSDNLGG